MKINLGKKKIKTEGKFVRKTDGQYNLSRCTGPLARILSKGAIRVSEFRRSYSGYNAVILDETGNELTFGNPRLYQTGSRNLLTMQAKVVLNNTPTLNFLTKSNTVLHHNVGEHLI